MSPHCIFYLINGKLISIKNTHIRIVYYAIKIKIDNLNYWIDDN